MTVSVIIPTKHRHKDLLNTVESVILQTHIPNEIIIIDQNPSSDVKEAVLLLFNKLEAPKKNIVLKHIHDPQITGASQAKNVGIEKNESDIALFLDDDVILEGDFIFNMLEIYKKHPDIYGVGGIVTNMKMGLVDTFINKIFMRGNFTDRRISIYTNPKYRDTEYVAVSKLSSGLTSYKREVFLEFRFDENFVKHSFAEDVDFSFRVSRKYKIVMTPKAKLIHVSSDLGRVNRRKSMENLIVARYYFFRKNLDKSLYNYVCFIWLNVGYVFNAFLLAIFKQDIDSLFGTFRGLKKIVMNEGSDFIYFHNIKG